MSTQSILLKPRPFARYSQPSGRFLLLPLLPERKPLHDLLPTEIWIEVFKFAASRSGGSTLLRSLLTVSKRFKEIAFPLVYSHVEIPRISALEKFYTRLHSADQKWDSIRRIPYSTPGRWVQDLNLSKLGFKDRSQALLLDTLLTHLFPLVPFLAHFSMNPTFILSRRAMASLGDREGVSNIRSLHGIAYPASVSAAPGRDDLVELLRRCVGLEDLEIIGQGFDPSETDAIFETTEATLPDAPPPLHLPNLNVLTLLHMHSSPIMLSLLSSPLPSLHKLTVTPYDDIPYPASLVSNFISTHGQSLKSLLLFTPKSWPTRLHPSPQTLLETSPNLRHLSLESPMPALTLPGTSTHPLQIMSIPRPNADCWSVLETLLPRLPSLCAVRARDVRWMRRGMTLKAQEAGVQGDMREWRRRLARRGIMVLDAEWKECEDAAGTRRL